jgi:hypothetical protein
MPEWEAEMMMSGRGLIEKANNEARWDVGCFWRRCLRLCALVGLDVGWR